MKRKSSRSGKVSLKRTVKHLMDRRQARLIDLGGFTLALYRQGRISDALLADKAAEVAALEDEILLIERGAVDRRHAREEAARGRGPKKSGRRPKVRRSAPEPASPQPAAVTPAPVAAAPEPAPAPAQATAPSPPPPPAARVDGQLDLNGADFDQLRGLGMSITQAKRVLEYRERIGSFSSIDDLDVIPGFPEHFRADLKHQIVV